MLDLKMLKYFLLMKFVDILALSIEHKSTSWGTQFCKFPWRFTGIGWKSLSPKPTGNTRSWGKSPFLTRPRCQSVCFIEEMYQILFSEFTRLQRIPFFFKAINVIVMCYDSHRFVATHPVRIRIDIAFWGSDHKLKVLLDFRTELNEITSRLFRRALQCE